jgi:hypothetical protein
LKWTGKICISTASRLNKPKQNDRVLYLSDVGVKSLSPKCNAKYLRFSGSHSATQSIHNESEVLASELSVPLWAFATNFYSVSSIW